MELLKLFNSYFNFFRVFGICIQTPDSSNRTKILSYCSSIFGLLYSSFLLFSLYIFDKPITGAGIVNYLQGICFFLTHITVMIETLATRKQQLQFWDFLKKIENLYGDEVEEIKLKYITCKRIVARKFWILLGFSIAIEITLLAILIRNRSRGIQVMSDWETWVVFVLSVVVGRIRHLSHLVFIEILKVHLEIFNNSLMKLKGNFNCLNTKLLIEELNSIKFRHTYIWELCQSINSCFQLSQLLNFFSDYLHLTSISYFVYLRIVYGKFDMILTTIILLIPVFSHIFAITKTSDDVQMEAQKSTHLLQNLMQSNKDSLNKFLKNCIIDLSLQMHHERISITIGKLFVLNL
uniref:Gustatory receptor n=1 Tax=Lutzomyia longipalpis TaxID=7200 RepID=A0A240SXX3_LUTLO